MKASHRDYLKAARRSLDGCRLFFLCGPDEGGAFAGAMKLAALLPEPGERVELSGQDLRADPVRLVDEARSTSLFGDSRHLLVRVAGDDAHESLRIFCEMKDRGEADQAWPVIVIASSATDKSRSAKLLIDRRDALVAVFYQPDLADFVAEVRAMADAAGLGLDGPLAERIARAVALDARLARAEIDKLALYLDASPQRPRRAAAADFAAIIAGCDEDGFMPIVNCALSGDLARLPDELARLRALALNPVGLALALERRVAQLAGLQARRLPGERVDQLLERNRVFRQDRADLAAQLQRWPAALLDRLVGRLVALHRGLLASQRPAELLLARELTLIAVRANRQR